MIITGLLHGRNRRTTSIDGRNATGSIPPPRVVRQNERPLGLKCLLTASKATLVPWVGLCGAGMLSPVFSGFSAATAVTALTSGAFAFLLYHDWGYIRDVQKSLAISGAYPSKGQWPDSPAQRLIPAVTITSMPESSVVVEGSVGSSLRMLSRFGRGWVYMVDDSKKLCNRLAKQHLAAEWNQKLALRNILRDHLLSSGDGIKRERAQEIADCLALGYEMELEVAVRQTCEKHGVSRAAEARLTNAIGVLRTIKDALELEGISRITDIGEREAARDELIGKIGRANWMRRHEREAVAVVSQNPDEMLMFSCEQVLAITGSFDGFEAFYAELSGRLQSEVRRERISRQFDRLILGQTNVAAEEKWLQLLAEEFPEIQSRAQKFNLWIQQNRVGILAEAREAAGVGSITELHLRREVEDLMRCHFLEENDVDLKEIMRMLLEDSFGLSNSCAEAIAARVMGRLFESSLPLAKLEGCSPEFVADDIERIVAGEIGVELQGRGLPKRMSLRLAREIEGYNREIQRATDEFMRWSLDEAQKLNRFAMEIAEGEDSESVRKMIRIAELKRPFAEELFPAVEALVLAGLADGMTAHQVSGLLVERIPAVLALGLAESHRLINLGRNEDAVCKSSDFCLNQRIETVINRYLDDWPEAKGKLVDARALSSRIASAVVDGEALEAVVATETRLGSKEAYYLAERVSREIKITVCRQERAGLLFRLKQRQVAAGDDLAQLYVLTEQVVTSPVVVDGNTSRAALNAVRYVHRVKNSGGKAGALGDVTGGYGIEAKVKNLVSLLVETKIRELKSGTLDWHAIPALVTRLDREVCPDLPIFFSPAEISQRIMGGINAGVDRETLAQELAVELNCSGIPVLARKLRAVVFDYPEHATGRSSAEIVKQIIAQSHVPSVAEVDGRKVWLGSALEEIAPLLDEVFSSDEVTFPRPHELIILDVRDKVFAKWQGADRLEREKLGFVLACLDAPLPAVGPQYEIFVQFDGGRHVNRDYLLENGAYYLNHPSVFLVQTRQHYGRNRWEHPLLVGADSDNDIFYEHMSFAKTHDNAGAPCGSGMVLPRLAWLWGGEWQNEIEYSGSEIRRVGGRIYYQIEDSITEDMACGAKYHRLGYRSIFSHGIHERGKGPPGIREFLAIQVHRWGIGIVGELRLERERGSLTTLVEMALHPSRFTLAQMEQYLRSMISYLTAVANVVCLASPALFLLVNPVFHHLLLPVMPLIVLRVLASSLLYPLSMRQRGLPMRECIALVGFTLLGWERIAHAAYIALFKKSQGEFGVSKKEGAALKMDLRTGLGRRFYLSNIPFVFSNFGAFCVGAYQYCMTGNVYFAFCAAIGLMYSSLLVGAWQRYNVGADPLPPKPGRELLRLASESGNPDLKEYVVKELSRGQLAYSKLTQEMARAI